MEGVLLIRKLLERYDVLLTRLVLLHTVVVDSFLTTYSHHHSNKQREPHYQIRRFSIPTNISRRFRHQQPIFRWTCYLADVIYTHMQPVYILPFPEHLSTLNALLFLDIHFHLPCLYMNSTFIRFLMHAITMRALIF